MKNSGRIITSHEATVKTVQVAIRTLMVKDKQVTLAVFKQLQKEELLDTETGELHGVPWGKVNYFWGECIEGLHLHIVWQKGDELRRACVGNYLNRTWGFCGYDGLEETKKFIKDLSDVSKYKQTLTDRNILGDREQFEHMQRYRTTFAAFKGMKCYRGFHPTNSLSWFEQEIAKQTDILDQERKRVESAEGLYKRHYTELVNLDQLFIAV